jgi:hypothetical protein
MLDSDRGKLPPGTESADLADFVQAGVGRARTADYEGLLAKIGARTFRYFPRSGNFIVPVPKPGDPFAVTRKSYSYLNREGQQPLVRYHGYGPRGPAVYWATGDHRIKGRWFIHHDATVVGAFAPY